jgi:hypothetical protein
VHSSDPYWVVELRRYALRPGQRETLIELFDREFVETQEAVGMRILGQFRDLDDPDCFVWMRGFADMETRKEALESFYRGPVWKQHAQAANATMINSDDVLLLSPVAGLEHDPSRRAAPGSTPDPSGVLVITIWPLAHPTAAEVPALFQQHFEPALRDAGITVLATYTTEQSENTFPALPYARTRTSSSGCRCSRTKPIMVATFASSNSAPSGAARGGPSPDISRDRRRSSG